MQYIYLVNALCPAVPPSLADQTAIPAYDIPELLGKRETHSLRQLAREYGVSHETIRKAVETANKVNIHVPGGGGGDDISNKDPGS